MGMSRLGAGRVGAGVFGDLQVGYGVADRLSAYLGVTLQANGFLADAAPGLRLGAFTTLIDTDHFDLDLLLEFGGDGPGFSRVHVLPGTELNLDFDTALGRVGLYLRGGLRVAGQQIAGVAAPAYETTLQLQLTPGLSWSPREGHRLLVETGGLVHFACSEAPRHWEHAGVALGYNRVLSPQLELITQVSLTPRLEGGSPVFGVLAGFIATVPGAR
jgi:hypothetical protein